MTETVAQALRTMLGDFLGWSSRRPIVNELRLYHDMGLSGDDAGEFLDAIHARFSTRFEGFEFETYFPNEGEGLPRFLRKLGLDDHKKPFTFSHLVKIVEAGQWSEPGTEAEPQP